MLLECAALSVCLSVCVECVYLCVCRQRWRWLAEMLHLPDVAGLSSTIVETVSLDVADFSECFLTCGTCLQLYDGATRRPKLLPCSHSLCLACVRVISEDVHHRPPRCPVCNAAFCIPSSGGPAALPPSFVVNQLLDLMSSAARRDVVPRCARHLHCQLLFCETCDVVFCADCDDDDSRHKSTPLGATTAAATSGPLTSSSAAHNVVPFAIAIRRVSEILQFKATQCVLNLDAAAAAVDTEMRQVDARAERCIETISRAFAELTAAVEQRQRAVVDTVDTLRRDKSHVLTEQLALIAAQRDCARAECERIPPDVRAITSRIGKLNELIDASLFLAEPRENAFIAFHVTAARGDQLNSAIAEFGVVRTSETSPALCTVEFCDPEGCVTVNVPAKARLVTYDASGRRQTVGGDPVCVDLVDDSSRCAVPVMVLDVGDGSYELLFTVLTAGPHSLTVRIFDRIVGSCSRPLGFIAHQFHRPVVTYVGGLHQPVAVALDGSSLYVLDTGNSRLAVYDTSSSHSSLQSPVRSIVNESLAQRGATGMSFIHSHDDESLSCLYVINWRTSRVSCLSACTGLVLHSFHCPQFVEPTAVTVANDGSVFVADNGTHLLLVFAACTGKLIRTIILMGAGGGACSKSDLVTCIYATSAPRDEILVCDHRVRALSYNGEFLYELTAGDSRGRGQYGGVVVDGSGRYLASRSERGRAMIQVFDSDRRWCFSIECDQQDTRLRRPSGLAVDCCGHVYVADLGNNSVRKFRYT